MCIGVIKESDVKELVEDTAEDIIHFSMIYWSSKVLHRKASSPFVAEAIQAKITLGFVLYLQHMLGELLTGCSGYGVKTLMQTDCYSLYENVHTVCPQQKGKRLTTDLAQIRECIEGSHIEDLIWRSEAIQLSDPLTKPMNTDALRNACNNVQIPTRPLKETKRQKEQRRSLEKRLLGI